MKNTNDERVEAMKQAGETDADWLSRISIRDQRRRAEWSKVWTVTVLEVR
jgi:hypothetical protein